MRLHNGDAFLSTMIISGKDANKGLTSPIFISTFHVSYRECVLERGRGPLTSLTTLFKMSYKSDSSLMLSS